MNNAQTITTAQTLDGILAQVAVNQVDLPGAVKAMADATTQDEQGVLAVSNILAISPTAATAVAVPGAAAQNAKTGGNAKAGQNAKNARRAARVFIS